MPRTRLQRLEIALVNQSTTGYERRLTLDFAVSVVVIPCFLELVKTRRIAAVPVAMILRETVLSSRAFEGALWWEFPQDTAISSCKLSVHDYAWYLLTKHIFNK